LPRAKDINAGKKEGKTDETGHLSDSTENTEDTSAPLMLKAKRTRETLLMSKRCDPNTIDVTKIQAGKERLDMRIYIFGLTYDLLH